MTTQAHLYKQDDALKVPAKTGWPAPELAQDDHRPLFKCFASRLGSRRLVRDAAAAIGASHGQRGGKTK